VVAGVAHRHTKASRLQHRNIVVAVADRHDAADVEAEQVAEAAQPAALVDAGGGRLDQPLVGARDVNERWKAPLVFRQQVDVAGDAVVEGDYLDGRVGVGAASKGEKASTCTPGAPSK
jgi:hypothetical protein